MKVVLEAQHMCTEHPRGIARYVISLIRKLAYRKNNDYALTFFDKGKEMGNRAYIERYFGDLNLPLFECNSLSYRDAFWGDDKTLYEEYTGASGDVFHFMHMLKFPRYIEGIPVVTVHDIMPILYPQWFNTRTTKQMEFFLNRIMDIKPLLLADSMATKADLVNIARVNAEDILVTPLSCDSDRCYPEQNDAMFKTLSKLKISSPYILYFGPIDERKNIISVLKAFTKVSEKRSELKFVVSGVSDPSNSGPVMESIEKFNHPEKLIFLGPVDDDCRRALYSGAKAFVFPSLYEGFGFPVLEAFACGCPVITSNSSSLPEVAGDAAILVDPLDVEEIAAQIERVLSDESLSETLKSKGIKRAAEFTWDKTAELTEQAYKTALYR
jgi:glycosyltransferase involved in cell wall biosynthesis